MGADLPRRSLSRTYLVLLLGGIFLFRLAFGLMGRRWGSSADDAQVYLLGLKFYTTGAWPYFGPDVVWTKSQIPGALQGLLVGGPLYLIPIPEAPFVLLNLLSFGALAFLAWYMERRVPGVPRWFVWMWLLLSPWTINFSTHVINPSYVLPGAVLFLIGLLEGMPRWRLGAIPITWAWAMMGFGVTWVFQLHMSYPIMLPFLALAAFDLLRRQAAHFPKALGGLVLGAAVPGSLLLPTFMQYGLGGGLGGTEANVVTGFELSKLLELLLTILARFLSFASYELPRFLGSHTVDRMAFLSRQPWVIPFAAFAGVVGLLQPIALLVLFFRPNPTPHWQRIRWLAFGTVMLLFVSFLFSIRGPRSHTFYLVYPIANLFAFACWAPYFERRLWRGVAIALLVSGVLVNVSQVVDRFPSQSFYQDRPAIKRAIDARDYRVYGERRADIWGCCY